MVQQFDRLWLKRKGFVGETGVKNHIRHFAEAKALKSLRQSHVPSLSQKTVADALGVPLAVYRAWERGEDSPSFAQSEQMEKIYGWNPKQKSIRDYPNSYSRTQLNSFFASAKAIPSETALSMLEKLSMDQQTAFIRTWFNWVKVSEVNSPLVMAAFRSELEDSVLNLLDLAQCEIEYQDNFPGKSLEIF